MTYSRLGALLGASMALVALLAAGCQPPGWRPPAPRGQTWAYSSRGAFVSASAGGGGRAGPIPYFYHFSGGHFTGPPEGQPPDRFWRSHSTSERKLFNAHLEGRGERVRRGPAGPRLMSPGAPHRDATKTSRGEEKPAAASPSRPTPGQSGGAAGGTP